MTQNNSLSAMTFLIEGDVNVEITITDLGDGSLQFDVAVLDDTGSIGDLNGLFFDMLDPSLLDGMIATGDDITNQDYAEGDVDNLGGGVNVRGELTADGGFDAGIRFGTSGMSKDDIQETSFVLSHESEELVLEDMMGMDFGVRLTSVGEEGGEREDSLKLGGTAPEEPDTVVDLDDDPVIDGDPITTDPVLDTDPELTEPTLDPIADPLPEDPVATDANTPTEPNTTTDDPAPEGSDPVQTDDIPEDPLSDVNLDPLFIDPGVEDPIDPLIPDEPDLIDDPLFG